MKCELCEREMKKTYYKKDNKWKSIEQMYYCDHCDKLQYEEKDATYK